MRLFQKYAFPTSYTFLKIGSVRGVYDIEKMWLQNPHFSVATLTNHFIVRSPSISYHQIHLLMTTLITTSQIFFKYF